MGRGAKRAKTRFAKRRPCFTSDTTLLKKKKHLVSLHTKEGVNVDKIINGLPAQDLGLGSPLAMCGSS